MENKISLRQMQALIIVESFGVMAVYLPQGLAGISPQTGWLWALVGGVLVACIGYMAVSLNVEALYKHVAGRFVCVLLCVKIILCTGIWLRFFSSTINSLLLEKTPPWIISGIMALLCLYISTKGIETRARTGEIIFLLVGVIIVFVFMLCIPNIEINNLLPFSTTGGVKATAYTVLSVFGAEYLIFVTPYLDKKENAPKSAFYAGVIGAVILAITIFLTTAIFGANGVLVRSWAVLQVVNTIDFPLMLLERQDVIITAFWIGSAFVFLNAGTFYTGMILSRTCTKGKKSKFVYLLSAAIIWVVSLYPSSTANCVEILGRLKAFNIIIYALIIVAFIVKRRGRAGEK